MAERLPVALLAACLLVLGACSDGGAAPATTRAEPPSTKPEPPPTTDQPTTTERETTTSRPSTTTATSTTEPATATTTAAPSTSTSSPPTTTAAPASCTRAIQPGDSLSAVVASVGDAAVTIEAVTAENEITDPNTINAGDTLDICVGNGIDDITGQPRITTTTAPPPPTIDPAVAAASGSGVAAQQAKLNALFGAHGMPGLDVDGSSGRLTEQQLCAARVALGLPASRADMDPGSAEEQALMGLTALPIPAAAPTGSGRWVLIDQTCQVLFAGEGGGRLVFAFRTSTGQAGYETRDQDGARAFRYDPATDNGGWHNSIDYPVSVDNPLNGNMYKPIYFDRGQAIHGANNVPTSPQSKGCARLPVDSQQALVDWLGLGGAGSPIWDAGQIDLTVDVQGHY